MLEPTGALEMLLEKVRPASGPSRELDAWIHLVIVNEGRLGSFPSPEAWVRRALGHGWNTGRYSSSIDAALELVQHVLPGSMWATGCMESGPFCRLVYPIGHLGGWGHEVSSEQEGGPATEPVAILCCLIAAKLAVLRAGLPDVTGICP